MIQYFVYSANHLFGYKTKVSINYANCPMISTLCMFSFTLNSSINYWKVMTISFPGIWTTMKSKYTFKMKMVWRQFSLLTRKNFILLYRNKVWTSFEILMPIFISTPLFCLISMVSWLSTHLVMNTWSR